jgi:hypothetical protein
LYPNLRVYNTIFLTISFNSRLNDNLTRHVVLLVICKQAEGFYLNLTESVAR